MIFTTWISDRGMSAAREQCFDSVRKIYPDIYIFYKEYCQGYIKSKWPDYPAFMLDNNVLMSDCFKCLFLSHNPNSLYIDTDILLFSPLVIDSQLAGIGWSGTIQLNCILYSGQNTALFKKIFDRFALKPAFNYCETRYEFEQVPHQIFKDGYKHLALGTINGWKNE